MCVVCGLGACVCGVYRLRRCVCVCVCERERERERGRERERERALRRRICRVCVPECGLESVCLCTARVCID